MVQELCVASLPQSFSENWSFNHNPYHVALDRSDVFRFSCPTFSVDIRVHLLSCQFLIWMSAYLVPLLGRHLREHLEKFVRRHMLNKLWALNEEIYSCVPSMEPIRLRQLLSCLNTHADVLNKCNPYQVQLLLFEGPQSTFTRKTAL